MVPGAQLHLDLGDVRRVDGGVGHRALEQDRRASFTWIGYDPAHPTTVEFRFVPWAEGTYVQVTETGFSGDGDTQVSRALDSTQGFTFLLSSLKAFLEHDVVLRLVLDAHPAGLQI